jgi:hypothetical protein
VYREATPRIAPALLRESEMHRGRTNQDASGSASTTEELSRLVQESASTLGENEVLSIVANKFVTADVLGRLAVIPRITAFYSVRLALVAHRQTPQAHAVRLVHYLHWFDLLRLSLELKVPAPVRRAIDKQLLARLEELALGERISSARRCGSALIAALLFDPDPKVFEALLVNRRLREDELLALIASGRATVEQLRMIAADERWSRRYAIRRALVMNPSTPRAVAAAHVRGLTAADLRRIHANTATSTYIRRCIERIRPEALQPRRK